MTTTTENDRKPGGKLPPRFVIRAAWIIHRALLRVLGRRRALRPARHLVPASRACGRRVR